MIEGYLGQVLPKMVVGWVFDPAHPDAHLVVDIYCGDRHLGSTSANIYRPALARVPIGEGDHGFMFAFPSQLDQRELAAVVARTRSVSNPTLVEELPRAASVERSGTVQAAPSLSVSAYKDESQYPVFVVGAPRSGTSAVAQSLRNATQYGGYDEGTILDLVCPLQQALRRFYKVKDNVPVVDLSRVMISKIPEGYFADGLSALFANAVKELFPSRHWCDKTPTPEMIWAAPSLLRLWPNSRFIFMKRRALENLASRIRKFREVPFQYQCTNWSACMEAWLSVRGELKGHALELDQHFLAVHPSKAAEAVGRLLTLESKEVEKLAQIMGRYRPEQTSGSVSDVLEASMLSWDRSKWAIFDRICGPAMTAYGYSRDQTYYAAGAEERGCLAL